MISFRTVLYYLCLSLAVLSFPMVSSANRNYMRSNSIYADALRDGLSLYELFGAPQAGDYIVVGGDTIRFDFNVGMEGQLTERDYAEVAEKLDIEIAAIKAVVEIETGNTNRGFNPDGTPIVNFNIKVFDTMTRRHNVCLSAYAKSHPLVFSRLDVARFGTPQAAEHARLSQAMSIDSVCAIEGTFWGMFQIGGFNWKRCAAKSPHDFMERMSHSEREQLELFAAFLKNSGLLKFLQVKDWVSFARGYNGPTYASHAYHTRLKKAYNKYSVNKI